MKNIILPTSVYNRLVKCLNQIVATGGRVKVLYKEKDVTIRIDLPPCFAYVFVYRSMGEASVDITLPHSPRPYRFGYTSLCFTFRRGKVIQAELVRYYSDDRKGISRTFKYSITGSTVIIPLTSDSLTKRLDYKHLSAVARALLKTASVAVDDV